MSNIYGWISPRGKFTQCDMWEHLSVVDMLPEVTEEIKDKVSEITSSLKDIEDSCLSAIDNDEHPAWHNYCIAEMDYKHELWELLTNTGFIRVAQSGKSMFFEGKGKWIANNLQVCKNIAENNNCDAVFERR